jgi:regulator of sirC expression with transglutaminase-like and TPR domain
MNSESGRETAIARFRRFVAQDEPDLFEGALLISRLIDPDEDLERARARVAAFATRVREAKHREATGCEALRRVLFAEEGFRGDAESYDDPRNSSVAHVLAARRGMPITLAIVVLEVGRRAGLALHGVGLPGHFVVGGPDLPEGRYLDPFDGGDLYDAAAVARRVGAIFGTPVELPSEAFLPDSPREILTRVLYNLRRSCEKRGRLEEALAALDCAQALMPEDSSVLRERGLLLLRLGRTREAVAALEAYVAAGRGEDLEAVAKLLSVVRDRESSAASGERRVFTLAEARALLSRIQEITAESVSRCASIGDDAETEAERQEIVRGWVEKVSGFGVEVKGLWLVDFDSGAGYYCWKFPEPSLDYFHGYDEGFAGRLPLQ